MIVTISLLVIYYILKLAHMWLQLGKRSKHLLGSIIIINSVFFLCIWINLGQVGVWESFGGILCILYGSRQSRWLIVYVEGWESIRKHILLLGLHDVM
jgi:hypothetical protein